MDKTQAALRYILADGSGAVLVEGRDSVNGPVPHEVLGTYVESVGMDRAPGMTAGGGVADLVEPNSRSRGVRQGFAPLGPGLYGGGSRRGAVPDAGGATDAGVAAHRDEQGDHYVYSIPGRQLYEANLEQVTAPFGSSRSR